MALFSFIAWHDSELMNMSLDSESKKDTELSELVFGFVWCDTSVLEEPVTVALAYKALGVTLAVGEVARLSVGKP